jgi:hypothetical protein
MTPRVAFELCFIAGTFLCLAAFCSIAVAAHEALTTKVGNFLDCFSKWQGFLEVNVLGGVHCIRANIELISAEFAFKYPAFQAYFI